MKFPELCIRKPVLATVFSLVMIVLGVVAFLRLDIRFFPELNLPILTVSTSFSGADAKLMESQVTTPLENAIAGVSGIKYISSSSHDGSSKITVMFNQGGDFESEASEVRDKVAGEVKNLPTGIEPPVVTTGTHGSVVINYGITQAGKTSAEVRDYVRREIVPVLRQLKGVGSVNVNGAWDYAMRIWLNGSKMAALGVTVSDVENALKANNIYFAAGSFYGKARNYGVITKTQLKTPAEFANIIVRSNIDGTIRLKDVANVKQGYTTPFPTPLYLDGKQGVVLNVSPLESANPISVAKEVKQQIADITPSLPSQMRLKVIYDKATYLQAAINETFETIAEAIVLVILVVLLFLGSVRAALVPIATIPVSMISVFFIMYLFGFSINTMSLLGMVLAIGLVVDDAIVMLENIHRHLEAGLSPFKASIKGSKEIMFAVLAMTVTLMAVYAPIGLAQGFTATLFQQFAFTLAGAVVISGFVALSLSPMMCSKLLVRHQQETRYTRWLEKFFLRLTQGYKKLLLLALKRRLLIVGVLLVIAGLGYFLLRSTPSEFIPADDYGQFSISVSTPAGVTAKYVGQYLGQIKQYVDKVPAVEGFGYQLLDEGLLSFFTLKPWQQRHLSVQQIAHQLNKDFANITGVTVTASVPDVIDYGEKGAGLELDLMTTGSYEDLLEPSQKIEQILKSYPGVYNVNSNLKFDTQEYALTLNRDLAAASGVNLQDIADTISVMMGGTHVTNLQSSDEAYKVILQMRKQDMLGFGGLHTIFVRANNGKNAMVPLANFVNLKPIVYQGSLKHYNRMRAASITASLSPGYTMGQVVTYLQTQLPSVITPGIHYAYVGKADQFLSSSGSMLEIFILSFIFIYLVLSAQFGSFIDPFIILLSVPLSMVGALLFLKLDNGTLNLYSEIGLVTLVGMISKHGILITQFVNNARASGKDMIEAILEGASLRLRPVLMTTAAMVFGTLPLALAVGPGSNGRSQIGWVIVGGLILGTFFSLVVVPIAYYYLGRFKSFKSEGES